MAWKTKVLTILEECFKQDDSLDHVWEISRRVDEDAVPPKHYARELQKTKHYVKNGVAATFPITLTLADVRWIIANGAKIEAALKPTTKSPAAAPAQAAPAAVTPEIVEEPF